MGVRLPLISNAADFAAHFGDDIWQQVAAEICLRHNLRYTELRRPPPSEHIIFFVDSRFVIKIYAPFRRGFERELAALQFARGKMSIAAPEVLQVGEFENFKYLVMTAMTGVASREVWEKIELRDKFAVISRLSTAMRELNSHYAPAELKNCTENWQQFVCRQAEESVERQRACGANPECLESLPAFLAERLKLLPGDEQTTFLHGDIHAGNLLLVPANDGWQISGLIDFADSRTGFHEYELLAPGVLMTQGNRELQREMLSAYGYKAADLDENLRARLMLLLVLYECSNLRKYALRLAPEAIDFTLVQLEEAIWAFC
jgi:hygromycin-B 7''-O-kinase